MSYEFDEKLLPPGLDASLFAQVLDKMDWDRKVFKIFGYWFNFVNDDIVEIIPVTSGVAIYITFKKKE